MEKYRFDVLRGNRVIAHISAESLTVTVTAAMASVGYLIVGPYPVKAKGYSRV